MGLLVCIVSILVAGVCIVLAALTLVCELVCVSCHVRHDPGPILVRLAALIAIASVAIWVYLHFPKVGM